MWNSKIASIKKKLFNCWNKLLKTLQSIFESYEGEMFTQLLSIILQGINGMSHQM